MTKKAILLISFFFSVICTDSLFSQIPDVILEKAVVFISEITGERKSIKNFAVLDNEGELKNYVVNFNDKGYVLLESSTAHSKVVAFSENGEYIPTNISLIPISEQTKESNSYSSSSKVFYSNKDIFPFLKDIWGGVNCKDDKGRDIYPSNYYTPNHSSPGCVAISMAQILHFYEWPKTGMGNNVYLDDYNGSSIRHSSFFDNIQYDWQQMLDEYMNVSSTETEQKAIGTLMYHCGVALQMDYEPSGSTSNINKTPFVYQNFFRFSGHYKDIGWSEFWDRLNKNIQDGQPVPVAVDASKTGDGHVFVVDGFQEIDGTPFYHLNWGWYNDNDINGWYNIQGWTANSPGYNTITGAVFDLLPVPQITSIENTGTGNDFTINWEVSNMLQWEAFTLEQKIDSGNWQAIAQDITVNNYTVTNSTGNVHQFRVKSKVGGVYYDNSWSEIAIHSTQDTYNGYISFEGEQYAYARQTPNSDLNFTEDFTFETWLRLKPGNTDGNVVLNQQDVFSLEVSNITSTHYDIVFKTYSNPKQLNSSSSDINIPIDEWVHIAVSNSGSHTRLFINGTLVDQNEGADFELSLSDNALNIAEKYKNGYSSWLIADMDQLRLSTIGRYQNSFIPKMQETFGTDEHTTGYFTFQNVHNVRLKDEASRLSVIVKNEPGHAKWNLETINSLPEDSDHDGIPDESDLCPDTPAGSMIDANGCEIFSLASDNFTIKSTKPSCLGIKNGSISIMSKEILNYSITLQTNDFNKSDTFKEQIIFDNLGPGDYQVCISITDIPEFEQCFNVFLSDPDSLSVASKVQSKEVNLALSGGDIYYIEVNDQLFTTTRNSITISLPETSNKLKVSTDKSCQGVYNEVIDLEKEVIIYPNPIISNTLNILLKNFPDQEAISVDIFSHSGDPIFSKNIIPQEDRISLATDYLNEGAYILVLKINGKIFNYNIIKK